MEQEGSLARLRERLYGQKRVWAFTARSTPPISLHRERRGRHARMRATVYGDVPHAQPLHRRSTEV